MELKDIKREFDKTFEFEVFPTGSLVLDRVILGCGGLPAGRMIELAGEWGAGKSTIAQFIASAFMKKGVVLYIDNENSIDAGRMREMGVDVRSERFVVSQVELERLFPMIKDFVLKVREAGVQNVLVILDSLPATTHKEEMGIGYMSRYISGYIPSFSQFLIKTGTIFLIINQYRSLINFGDDFYPVQDKVWTPGGYALKHFVHIRVAIRCIKTYDDGIESVLLTMKNKFSSPAKSSIRINFRTGIDMRDDLRKYLIYLGKLKEDKRSKKWKLEGHDKLLEYDDPIIDELGLRILNL